jgi:hypothetical protein
MVYWDDPASLRSQDEKRHIFEVNLEVYNLISIFLSTSQILELIEMLNEENEAIFEAAILKFSSLVTRRRYYLVGSVVAGKSTSLEALRCFATFEEWFGRPPQVMYQDHKTLSPAERTEVDDWLYTQLREKNDRMRSTGVGIHIMDRGFLDLCAFSETGDENQKKLKEMRERVCRVSGPLENGQIIYLYAQEVVLSERQARRGKLRGPSKSIDYDGAALVQQDKALREIYRPGSSSVYDTSHQSADRISRRIAREILLGEYHPFNFEGRIDEILANGGNL